MNTGGSAFPYAVQRLQSSYHSEVKGMTLLDWMAGQALVGLIAKLPIIDQSEQFGIKVDDKIAYNRDVAGSCYALAEAMLAEKARREAVVKESQTTDHSGDANKMVEDHFRDAAKMTKLEAQNRELVEALEVLLCASEKVQKKGYAFAQLDRGVVMARAALGKAKETKS